MPARRKFRFLSRIIGRTRRKDETKQQPIVLGTSQLVNSFCDYYPYSFRDNHNAQLSHVHVSNSIRWHNASCTYVLSLFSMGILLVVSIFCGAESRRKRSKKTSKYITERRQKKSCRNTTATAALRVDTQHNAAVSSASPARPTDSSTISGITDADGLSIDSLGGMGESAVHDVILATESEAPPLFPENATEAEVSRFVRARKGDIAAGAKQLRRYLDWRKEHENILAQKRKNTPDDDAFLRQRLGEADGNYDWRIACLIARAAEAATAFTGGESCLQPLPCVVFLDNADSDRPGASSPTSDHTPPMKNNTCAGLSPSTQQLTLLSMDGARICHHIPARIDTDLASGQTYATALALYLDRRLSRNNEEKFDVIIDTRPGIGWANISAIHLVPFIRHASKLLNDLHPERLHRAIVFPVPSVFAFIWNRLVKPFMDPVTADKICVLGGTAKVTSKVPRGMRKFIGEDVLVEMERRRMSLFSSLEEEKSECF